LLQLQAKLAERDEQLAMLSCRPDRMEAAVQVRTEQPEMALRLEQQQFVMSSCSRLFQ
jgi:hypothetical protein